MYALYCLNCEKQHKFVGGLCQTCFKEQPSFWTTMKKAFLYDMGKLKQFIRQKFYG